ncbi:hypothetical protein TPHA_0O00120 [Tetrapisispora phaffii CBS 4417]|uniref:RRM domain-containing protein n=1 Tax=Tetrapisispora phaffii (strain ATCC 24235 / CBS 4417 / NBRC 1672 / NRRL Y-8282 / UCD 70-5) TaxID=1071381 RepID=G8C1F6_TETPH|nr:hypothetical protein TPHA_0O00120 [Tetrapisispora phaffii CBS 4417]CCE65984.1 hypothetical protein TPHA_0O00120 [Tetrapisispora phaffii CBS 4417]
MDDISENKPGEQHRVARYRRRDVRNLDNKLGFRGQAEEPVKKRVKFSNLPVDVSDFTVEDMVKEFGTPVFSRFYEYKDGRTAVFELETPGAMEKVVEKYNDFEINGSKIAVEMFDLRQRKPKSSFTPVYARGSRGSHYAEIREQPFTSNKSSHGSRKKATQPAKPTVEELDAELEAYMKST